MQEYILSMRNINKIFPGVQALKNINFNVKKGEVHALVGENGAGKSTLIKILNGNHNMDTGQIYIEGQEVFVTSPKDAQELGIAVIFQELNLVPMLTIAENIFIGNMKKIDKKYPMIISWKKMIQESYNFLKHLGYEIDTRKKISDITVAERQMVEIARAVSFDAKIILMDEPSTTLSIKELKKLFNVIKELKQKGVTILYISHRLEEVFEICDAVTVLRDGEIVFEKPVSETNRKEIIMKMVGREVSDVFPKIENKRLGEEVLRVENLSEKEKLNNINFKLHKGEILGIAGLVGSGRTEMARAIFGVDYISSMQLYKDGKSIRIMDPGQAIKNSIAFITEDRKTEGLIVDFSVKMNLTMANIIKVLKGIFLNIKKEKKVAWNMVKQLSIKTPSLKQKVLNLSGGNQQKIVVGKWLISDADIFIMDEPTKGIDVGAKHEIYLLMNELIKQGKSVIFISSELPEVIGMSDRVLVMYNGEIMGQLKGVDITAVNVMQLCK